MGHNPYLNLSDYDVSPSSVTWQQNAGELNLLTMKLDRATLMLSYTVVGANEPSRWECKVYTSQDDFQLLMETQRVQKQAEIDERMRDNKI